MNHQESIADLRRIPGIGPSLAGDLTRIGIKSVADLQGADPAALYHQLTALEGTAVDRCVLYTFRCAVYFASTRRPDPELLKWWNWKDRRTKSEKFALPA